MSARSVKLIDQNLSTIERDTWWQELRKEIEQNALVLGCTHILGYRETMHIYEDIMIMNVYGSAIKVKKRTPIPFSFKKNDSISSVLISDMNRTHTAKIGNDTKDLLREALSPSTLHPSKSSLGAPGLYNTMSAKPKKITGKKKLIKVWEELRSCVFCHIIRTKNPKNQSYQ